MNEIDILLDRYYKETEKKKRDEILSQLEKAVQESDDGDLLQKLSHIRELYELRYTKKKKRVMDTEECDNFLFQCINLPYIYRNTMTLSFTTRRLIKEMLSSLGLDRYDTYDEDKKELLYREYRNTAACYIKTCETTSYRSLFGIIPSDDNKKKKHMVNDIYDMTMGISGQYNLENELKPWIKAVTDELFAASEEYRELFKNR